MLLLEYAPRFFLVFPESWEKRKSHSWRFIFYFSFWSKLSSLDFRPLNMLDTFEKK